MLCKYIALVLPKENNSEAYDFFPSNNKGEDLLRMEKLKNIPFVHACIKMYRYNAYKNSNSLEGIESWYGILEDKFLARLALVKSAAQKKHMGILFDILRMDFQFEYDNIKRQAKREHKTIPLSYINFAEKVIGQIQLRI